jgi:ferric-dicitrate binding protein FerR (iron transport regulator)
MVSIVPIPWIGEHIARFVKPPKPLDAGHEAVVDESGVASARLRDTTLATSWQQRRLAFDNEPLRYVVQDVNRYAATPILIEDAAVGDLRITGAVLCDNLDGWLASLERAFGLQVERSAERIVLAPSPRSAVSDM